MATFYACFAWVSQRNAPTRSEKPPTPSISRFARSARRWWRSWPVKFRPTTWRKLSTNCKSCSLSHLVWNIGFLSGGLKRWQVIRVYHVWKGLLNCFVSRSRIPDSVGKDIEKACQSIYPLHDVYVRKVKMLKKPKFECKSSSCCAVCARAVFVSSCGSTWLFQSCMIPIFSRWDNLIFSSNIVKVHRRHIVIELPTST